MQIQTPYGTQQVDAETLLNFPKGLIGFEDCTQFKLFHQENAADPLVHWLQAVEREDVMFTVTEPAVMNVDYHFELDDDEVALLDSRDPSDILVLLLLYKADETVEQQTAKSINAALRVPLVINVRNQIGLQKTLYDADISVLVKMQPKAG